MIPAWGARWAGRTRWWSWLALISGLALTLRVGYVLLVEHPANFAGDAYQDHHGANFLVDGKGFVVVPWPFPDQPGQLMQTAQHPPLFTIALAVPSALGLQGFLAHQLWSCLLGTCTVVVTGLLGRRLAGPRTGLVAAGLAAVYPNLWIYGGLVAPEALSLLMAALTLLAAYRLWDDPSMRTAAETGLAAGLAALTRGEAMLYLPLLVVPLVLLLPKPDLSRRLALIAVAALAAGVTVAPWMVYNLARFNHPVLATSNGLDILLVQANCQATYYGPNVGYWSLACMPPVPAPRGDETDDGRYFRRVALHFVGGKRRAGTLRRLRPHRADLGLLPPLRTGPQRRPCRRTRPHDRSGGTLDLLHAVARFGPRRCGPAATEGTTVPLVALIALVTLTVALNNGATRFRVSAELVPVLLSAVAVGALLERHRGAVAAAPGKAPATGSVSP